MSLTTRHNLFYRIHYPLFMAISGILNKINYFNYHYFFLYKIINTTCPIHIVTIFLFLRLLCVPKYVHNCDVKVTLMHYLYISYCFIFRYRVFRETPMLRAVRLTFPRWLKSSSRISCLSCSSSIKRRPCRPSLPQKDSAA